MKIIRKVRFGFLILYIIFPVNILFSQQAQVGNVIPSWSEGYLDIHHINTGKGESAFFILPDGTTMLVDAGNSQRVKPRVTDQKPNDSRTPGGWIARYILNMMDGQKNKKLDYILITHFHDDHMGRPFPGVKTAANGAFTLTGITEVGDIVPFTRIIDRNWPDYNWPVPLMGENMKNYRLFLDWHIRNNKIIVEKFDVGKNNQFVLLNDPGKYKNFEIRNLAANGHVWTGVGDNSRNHFPPLESLSREEYPNENKNSIAFRLSYGKFDYFNGGDITSDSPGTWQDIETPVGLVTGPVEVCLANHHAFYGTMSEAFLKAVRPRVHIIQAWAPSHPSSCVLSRMMSEKIYPGPRDVFSTNIMEATHVVIGSRIDNMKSRQGHIVIRVKPGGESFMIYILDDSEENFKITAVHGPYICD